MKYDVPIRCYRFAIRIVRFCQSMPNKNTFWVTGNQLLRSGTSVAANVIEAKSASSRKDYINFYTIALKSANETKYWLALLRDSIGYEKLKINDLLNEARQIANILAACIVSLKKNM